MAVSATVSVPALSAWEEYPDSPYWFKGLEENDEEFVFLIKRTGRPAGQFQWTTNGPSKGYRYNLHYYPLHTDVENPDVGRIYPTASDIEADPNDLDGWPTLEAAQARADRFWREWWEWYCTDPECPVTSTISPQEMMLLEAIGPQAVAGYVEEGGPEWAVGVAYLCRLLAERYRPTAEDMAVMAMRERLLNAVEDWQYHATSNSNE